MLALLVYGVGSPCESNGPFSGDYTAQGWWGGSVKSRGLSFLSSILKTAS